MTEKLDWQGTLISIQPRIRLTRSFDQRHHSYLGYALRIQGTIGQDEREFTVGIGKAAQVKHQFRAGDLVSGKAEPVADDRLEAVEFYKASGLKLIQRAVEVVPVAAVRTADVHGEILVPRMMCSSLFRPQMHWHQRCSL